MPRARLFRGANASLADPAEPWEIPLPKRAGNEFDYRVSDRPFRPTRAEEIPSAGLPALEAICGSLPFERLFVVPRTTRLVAPRRCVITPAQVLGFGDRAVGLWIDDGLRGRVVSSPVDRLIAVDDRRVLLYGRLRLVSVDTELLVRYNTVSRWALQENLGWLRGRMAWKDHAIEPGFLWLDPRDEGMGQPDLPYKWRVLLEHPTIRPNRDEPGMIAVGDVAAVRPSRDRPPSGVAVLGSRELVIASEPSGLRDSARYGVDLLAIPRERLDSLGWDGRSLTVHFAKGQSDSEDVPPITLTLDRCLVEAMLRGFGSAVRWA